MDLNIDPEQFGPEPFELFAQNRDAMAHLDRTIVVIQTANPKTIVVFISTADNTIGLRIAIDPKTMAVQEINPGELTVLDSTIEDE